MKNKFYQCRHCGQIVMKLKDTGVNIVCCGEDMSELLPNTHEGAGEKHVPIIKVEGNKVVVTVGSVMHPMVEEHYIQWILLATNKGNQRKCLKAGDSPVAEFFIGPDEIVENAYAFCNIHSLWCAK